MGGDNWRQTTDPQRWMKYSVLWFSQQITPNLGISRLTQYATGFGYGNADFSGDFEQTNGLERAWMSSSFRISPREQVNFLSRMISYDLPVSAASIDQTLAIIDTAETSGGWRVWGKPVRPTPAGTRAALTTKGVGAGLSAGPSVMVKRSFLHICYRMSGVTKSPRASRQSDHS